VASRYPQPRQDRRAEREGAGGGGHCLQARGLGGKRPGYGTGERGRRLACQEHGADPSERGAGYQPLKGGLRDHQPAELFPVDVRTTGHGISAGAGKLGAFAGAFLFPDFLAVTLGLNRAMLIAGIVAAAGMLLTIATVPEPKGKSLEELEKEAYEEAPARIRVRSARPEVAQ